MNYKIIILALVFLTFGYIIFVQQGVVINQLEDQDALDFCKDKGFDSNTRFSYEKSGCESSIDVERQYYSHVGVCCGQLITRGDKFCKNFPNSLKLFTRVFPPTAVFGGVC